MDAAILALATSGANSIVSLMASDAWSQVKSGFSRILGRGDSAETDVIAGQLEAARLELESATARNDAQAEDELRADWRGKLRRLLLEDPEAQSQLRDLLRELEPLMPTASSSPTINQSAIARDGGKVYQQGSGVQYNN